MNPSPSLSPSLGSLLVTQVGISVAEAQALEEWHCGVCLGTHKSTKPKPAMLAAAEGESTAGGKGATFGKKICPSCSHPNPVRKYACDSCGEPFMSGEPGSKASWSAEEMTHLVRLVATEGTGNWAQKAEALGTGRTNKAVEKKWRTELSDKAAHTAAQQRDAILKPHGQLSAQPRTVPSIGDTLSEETLEAFIAHFAQENAVSTLRSCKLTPSMSFAVEVRRERSCLLMPVHGSVESLSRKPSAVHGVRLSDARSVKELLEDGAAFGLEDGTPLAAEGDIIEAVRRSAPNNRSSGSHLAGMKKFVRFCEEAPAAMEPEEGGLPQAWSGAPDQAQARDW